MGAGKISHHPFLFQPLPFHPFSLLFKNYSEYLRLYYNGNNPLFLRNLESFKNISMIVEEQNVITISYELRENDAGGELMERMDNNYPFVFLFGTGKLLPAFEKKLHGLQEGDSFEFTLSPNEAYGPNRADFIVKVPREVFTQEGQIPVRVEKDVFVTLTDDMGDQHNGVIIDYNEEEVKVDLNHSMAGMTLHFKGVILKIREATVDELVRNHYIQAGGVRRPDFGEGQV